MKQKLEHYAQKKRQLKGLSRKMKKLLQSGEFQLLSTSTKERMMTKVRRLYKVLQYRIPRFELRKAMAGLALVGGLLGTNVAAAQDFAPPVETPFGLTTDPQAQFPTFADIDGDGDLDLFTGRLADETSTMGFQENIGDAQNPAFGNLQLNPFGISNTDYFAAPDLIDLDDDGDLDLLVGEYYGAFQLFENTGDAQNPAFAAPVENPFGLTSAYYSGVPTFGDLDGDGDYDLLAGEYYGNFIYFENTGTKAAPNFAAQTTNPFGLSAVVDQAGPDLIDLDGDGDLDILCADYLGGLKYFENTGDAQNPAFAAPVQDPFNFIGPDPVLDYIFPCTGDLDGDGDIDLLVSQSDSTLLYYENLEVNIGTKDQELQAEINLFPNPASTTVTLEIEDQKIVNNARLSLYNSLGQMLEERKITDSRTLVNVKGLPSGIYIAKITADNKQKAIRFTVE